jgi:hypothetical protein
MKKEMLLIAICITTFVNSQNSYMEFDYEYDQEKVNKNGQRDGELIHTTYDDTVEYKHLYKDGELKEATHYRYSVEGIRPLEGKYKDGEPFNGYFVYRNNVEIPLIDYYRNGVFTAQYTCSLLDLIYSEGQEFNLKFVRSTYENNKPQEGLFHKEDMKVGDAHLVASEYYKDGKITDVDLWVMAMHYAELIKLKFLPNGYKIYKDAGPEVEDEAIDTKNRSVTVNFADSKNGTVLFEVEDKIIIQYEFSYSELSAQRKPSGGFISYFFSNDNRILVAENTTVEINTELYNDIYGGNSNLISQVFLMLTNQIVPQFSNAGDNNYSLLLQPDEEVETHIMLYMDEKGNPFRGYLIEQQGVDQYKYTQYLDSKITSKKENLSVETLKEQILKAEQKNGKF